MENKDNFLHEQSSENIKIVDGVKYRKVDTGYTVREFFSHTTNTKGPGPGWDKHLRALEEYGVKSVQDLPNDAYFEWIEVEKNS